MLSSRKLYQSVTPTSHGGSPVRLIADATLSGRHLGGFDLFAILGLGDLLLEPLGVANLAHAVNSSREIYAKYF
jgi:hypothetical protein